MSARLARTVFLALFAFITTVYADPCTAPRVRREWRSISDAERADWIAAVKCLKTIPHKQTLTPTYNITFSQIPPINPNSSYFDDFVYTHMDVGLTIHFSGLFLPWHRIFINDFEAALRTECGYHGTQPYWDWTLDANPEFASAPIVKDFGGWGDKNNDYQITAGPFSEGFDLVYPVPHKVRRNCTFREPNPDLYGDGTPPPPDDAWTYITQARQEELIQGFPGDYEGFHAQFEGTTGSHAAIHQLLGGEMAGTCPQGLVPPNCYPGPKWPPNDPLFMLHHAMVDKIWSDWQNARQENFWSFIGGAVSAHSQPGLYAQFPVGGPPFLNFGTQMPTDGILQDATIFQAMNTTAERLCYIYEGQQRAF